MHHAAPTIVYQGAPTITAMQVRKEKEAELFANDQYWANRLKNQEAEFLKNSKIMEQEFNDTVSGCPSREAFVLIALPIFRWAMSRNASLSSHSLASFLLVRT